MFFIINLYIIFFTKNVVYVGYIKFGAVIVLFVAFYITKNDKSFLETSILLRIVLFFSSILGLIAFLIADHPM